MLPLFSADPSGGCQTEPHLIRTPEGPNGSVIQCDSISANVKQNHSFFKKKQLDSSINKLYIAIPRFDGQKG